MTNQYRKSDANRFVDSAKRGSYSLRGLTHLGKFNIRGTSVVVGVFGLAAILLIVGLWQVAVAYKGTNADQSNSPNVHNGKSITSNLQSQQGTTSQNNDGHASVTVDKNGNGPAKVSINGQPVTVPPTADIHKKVGNTTIDIQVQSNNQASGSNSTGSHGFSHTTTFSNSSSHVNSFIYSSGGSTIHN